MAEDFADSDWDVEGSTESLQNTEDLHKGGGAGSVSKAGWYHIQVESVKLKKTAKGVKFVTIQSICMAGTEESEVTKKIFIDVYLQELDEATETPKPLDERGMGKLAAVMYGFGVMGEEILGKETVRVSKAEWDRLPGCQAIGEVTLSKGGQKYKDRNGKDQIRQDRYTLWPNAIYRLTDEKVKDVPKDHELAASYGVGTTQHDDMDEV